MTRRLSILGFSLGVVILLAACGSGANPSGSAHSASAPPAAPTVLVAQDMTLGSILTDASGRTLYQFSPEKGGKIVCTGACLTPWPAALSGSAVAGAGGSNSPTTPGLCTTSSKTRLPTRQTARV